jgi:hypothetical protein
MKLRSPREIQFRLRQEAGNLCLAVRPPTPDVSSVAMRPLLPNATAIAERLANSSFALQVERLACSVLENRIPLFGQDLNFHGPIPWRRDWRNDREFAGAPYFRRVPYLDFNRVGDHKFIWELNRHQHLVLLAQALLMSGRREFMDALVSHWEDWVRENAFQCGINWTSALEVAFRALSWIWVYHMVSERMDETLRRRFLTELYRHGCHLEYNLSIYFSPNTHLLGEAVALHALGILFPAFPKSERWQAIGHRIARQELTRQVHRDGAHFEQSTYYHIYALDFFVLHYLLSGRPHEFEASLISMAEYLDAIQGSARRIPFVGDDDGGRLFHPYGARDCFGRATLATCAVLFHRPEWLADTEDLYPQAAWWLGDQVLDAPRFEHPPRSSRLFPDLGTAVLEGRDTFALVDGGGFGPFHAGHSHSDTLSIVLRRGDSDVLIDPGTFNYADAKWRNSFRGSSAHNTVRIDGLDQARPLGSFAWAGKPIVSIQDWRSTSDWDYFDATCRYDGHPLSHRRRILFVKDRGWVIVFDHAEGSGEHLVEQFWNTSCPISELSRHAYRLGDLAVILVDPTMETSIQENWRSPAYGSKLPSQQIVARARTTLPFSFAAAIVGRSDIPQDIRVVSDSEVAIGDSVWSLPPAGTRS